MRGTTMALRLPINRWLAIDLRGLRTVHLRTVIRWHSFDPCFTHDGFTPKGYGRGWNNVNNLLPGTGTYRLTHPGDTRVSFAPNITSSCQGSSIRTVTQLEMLGQSNILSQKWNIVYNELSYDCHLSTTRLRASGYTAWILREKDDEISVLYIY